MHAVNAVVRFLFTALDDLFLVGMSGTVAVLFLTFIEDVKTMLG